MSDDIKKKHQVGDKIRYVRASRKGKTITFETRDGIVQGTRLVYQVLVEDHGKRVWVDDEKVTP